MKIIDARIQNYFEQLGIDSLNPMFTWKLKGEKRNEYQKAYRIIVSRSVDGLAKQKVQNNNEIIITSNEICYDSGRVISDETINIRYQGKQLQHTTKYYWQVFVWDLDDQEIQSDIQHFVTGIYYNSEWEAKWISNRTTKPFYARKEVALDRDVAEAYVHVTGLGQFDMFINGKKVGNHEFDPGWTNYDKLVQYVTFDVTDMLKKGQNSFGLSIGNGWYIADKGERYFFNGPPENENFRFMPPNTNKYKPFSEELSVRAQIHIRYSNGDKAVIITDKSWKVRDGATKLTNVMGSEIYDAREYPTGWDYINYDDSTWGTASIVLKKNEPKGKLVAQSQPPIVIKKTYEPIEIRTIGHGECLVDLGQNMAGIFEIQVKGKKGSQIDIYPAEKLDGNGNIDQYAAGWCMIDTWSTYILCGKQEAESWRPEFSYAAGRWLLIKGVTTEKTDDTLPFLQSVKGHFITSASEDSGYFTCSNANYNKIYRMVLKAIESNLNSVHTDCPSIEKTAWLEINHLMAPSIMYAKNVSELWNKILTDIRHDQYTKYDYIYDLDRNPVYLGEGFIGSIAPAYSKLAAPTPIGSFWDIAPWASTAVIASYWHYKFYGDIAQIEMNYETGKKYVEYLETKLTHDKFINHGLGDWGNPLENALAKENIETAFYYVDLMLMACFAGILQKDKDQKLFSKKAKEILDNYNEKLLVKNPETGHWCYKVFDHKDEIFLTQACQAIPLYWDMVPEDKKEEVIKSFKKTLDQGAFLSGEVGLPYIIQSMAKYNENARLAAFMMQQEHPSYLRFIEKGETTLPEYWKDNSRSRNHDMMGHIMEWYYNGIAGIISEINAFKSIRITPYIPKDMDSFKCIYNSARGRIAVAIERIPECMDMDVTIEIPPNTSAVIDFSLIFTRYEVIENGKRVSVQDNLWRVDSGIYKVSLNCI